MSSRLPCGRAAGTSRVPVLLCAGCLTGLFASCPGLLDNPELRVVLVFGYNCCKAGASTYLQRVVSTFSDMNVILAGGQVDHLSSLTCGRYVPALSIP